MQSLAGTKTTKKRAMKKGDAIQEFHCSTENRNCSRQNERGSKLDSDNMAVFIPLGTKSDTFKRKFPNDNLSPELRKQKEELHLLSLNRLSLI